MLAQLHIGDIDNIELLRDTMRTRYLALGIAALLILATLAYAAKVPKDCENKKGKLRYKCAFGKDPPNTGNITISSTYQYEKCMATAKAKDWEYYCKLLWGEGTAINCPSVSAANKAWVLANMANSTGSYQYACRIYKPTTNSTNTTSVVG